MHGIHPNRAEKCGPAHEFGSRKKIRYSLSEQKVQKVRLRILRT